MIRVIQGDITKITGFDAIVNSANNSLLGGGGIDGQIHRAAGPQLRTECRKLNGCETGASRLTLGYNLPCKYIIHSVGPVWMGGTAGEDSLLKDCYKSTMKIALDNKIRKLAFSPISAGEYGYPAELASEIALTVIYDFVSKNPDAFEDICFVVTDELSENVYGEQIDDILKKLEEAKQKAEAKKKAAKKPKNTSAASKNKASEEDESKNSEDIEELKDAEEDGAAETTVSESDETSSDSDDSPNPEGTEKEPSENETESAEEISEAISDDESGKENTDTEESEENSDVADVSTDEIAGAADVNGKFADVDVANNETLDDSETSADDTTDDTEKETEADTSETASDINISLLRSALASRAATDSGILKPWDRYDIGWLIDDIASGLPHTYACFWHANEGSENNVLSHWYRGNPIFINGRKYDTVEQYIMSERALMFNDFGSYKLIMDEPDPSKCKKYGRNIQNFDEQSWNNVFREIIFRGSVAKALSDKRFADALIATGDSVLIEASPFDDIYGAGLRKDQLFSEDGTLIIPPEEWRAYKSERQSQNIMGFVLMSVRDYIRHIITAN